MGNRFVTSLEKEIQKRNDVKDWVFTFSSSDNMEVGMENGQLAGPYKPPTVRKGFQADVYVVWEDGSVSDATVEPHQFSNLDAAISEWRANSYTDPDAAPVRQPEEYQKPKLFDPKVNALLTDYGHLFDVMNKYLSVMKDGGAENIEGRASVKVTDVFLRSSTGMDEHYKKASMSSFAFCEGQFGEGDGTVKFSSLDDVEKLAQRAVDFYKIDQIEAEMPTGMTNVILSPDTATQFMDFYLGEHLHGGMVAEKKSKFKPEDFKKEKQIFHPNLTLVLDGITDYETGSAPFDGHGVPGGYHELVKNGKLQTPILNSKWGNKLGMNPTGTGDFYAHVPGATPLDDMISNTDDGVVIHQFLGLHTQSYEKGDYSVPVTIAHRVKNGEVVGSGKLSLSGNIFDDLSMKKGNAQQVEFCYDPLHPRDVGYKIIGKVQPMA